MTQNTVTCRKKTHWDYWGTSVKYRVPGEIDENIDYSVSAQLSEYLGAVKLRADGRWDWWRWKSKFHKWSTGQGVAATEDEAKVKVLEGWEAAGGARWEKAENFDPGRPEYHYRVPTSPGGNTFEYLATVKRQRDGLWYWRRRVSRHHEKWTVAEGIQDTEEAAKICVLNGWA